MHAVNGVDGVCAFSFEVYYLTKRSKEEPCSNELKYFVIVHKRHGNSKNKGILFITETQPISTQLW